MSSMDKLIAMAVGSPVGQKVLGTFYDPIGGGVESPALQKMVDPIIDSAKGAANLTEQAMGGQVPSPEQTMKTMLELGAQGSALGRVAGPTGKALGVFVGPRSKGWDQGGVKTAASMMKRGESAEDAWKATGYWRDPQNQWKREISDLPARWKKDAQWLTWKDGRKSNSLEAALDHPELFKAYPELKGVTVIKQPMKNGANGEFNFGTKNTRPVIRISDKLSDKEAMSTLVHEIQHAIQQREGTINGLNPAYVSNSFSKLRGSLLREGQEALMNRDFKKAETIQAELRRLARFNNPNGAFKVYQRSPGEIEARQVQNRLGESGSTLGRIRQTIKNLRNAPWKGTGVDRPWGQN